MLLYFILQKMLYPRLPSSFKMTSPDNNITHNKICSYTGVVEEYISYTYRFLMDVISRMSQIKHFHDLIFEDHQVSCSLIDASQSFAKEISRMKIFWMASRPRKPQKLHPSKICTYTDWMYNLDDLYIVKKLSLWYKLINVYSIRNMFIL